MLKKESVDYLLRQFDSSNLHGLGGRYLLADAISSCRIVNSLYCGTENEKLLTENVRIQALNVLDDFAGATLGSSKTRAAIIKRLEQEGLFNADSI